MAGLKMAVAPKEHISLLMKFMQFTEQISQLELSSKEDWERLKRDYEDEPKFVHMFKHMENEYGKFEPDYYFDYFRNEIEHIYMRIIIGYEVLFDNCCDPNADCLEFNQDIIKGLELLEQSTKQ